MTSPIWAAFLDLVSFFLVSCWTDDPQNHLNTGLLLMCPNKIWDQNEAKFLCSLSCRLHLSCPLAWEKVTRDPNSSWELSVLEHLGSAEKSLIAMRTVSKADTCYILALVVSNPSVSLAYYRFGTRKRVFSEWLCSVSTRSETKDELCRWWLAKTLRNLEWDVPVAAYFKYVTFHPRVFPQTRGWVWPTRGCALWSLWPRCPIKRNWQCRVEMFKWDASNLFVSDTSKRQSCCLPRGMRCSFKLLSWQSGKKPEKPDDRQTASPWYQRLPICRRMPQDIRHARVTAVYCSVSHRVGD